MVFSENVSENTVLPVLTKATKGISYTCPTDAALERPNFAAPPRARLAARLWGLAQGEHAGYEQGEHAGYGQGEHAGDGQGEI